MYGFVDTIEKAKDVLLPSEALSFNGEYLENLIPGYRTLYVSGREVLESELIQDEVGTSDGTRFRRKRYPSRTIVVGYALQAQTNAAFRAAYNKLNTILDVDEAQLIFADEPDKYFVGTKQQGSDVSPGTNYVTGELEFFCADPFKYAVEEKEVIPTLDDGKTFVIDYEGTYKCFPCLQVHAKADLGFAAFINQDEKIIQLGDVEEVDEEHYEASQTLVDDVFGECDLSEWKVNVAKTTPFTSSGNNIVSSIQSGTMDVSVDSRGIKFLKSTNYGSGAVWHGPSVTKSIPTDLNGKIGARNCTFSFKHLFAISATTEIGFAQFHMTSKKTDGTQRNVAGICFAKGGYGTTERAHMYVDGSYQTDITFSVGRGNDVTGYNAGRISISKFGGQFTFNLNGKVYEFYAPQMTEVEVNEISIYLGGYEAFTPIYDNGVYSVKFVKHGVDAWRNVPNKFLSNDLITADCRNGKIMVNGVETSGLGALGNDWENFYLKPGKNQIHCTYSNWAVTPEFSLKYREVFL